MKAKVETNGLLGRQALQKPNGGPSGRVLNPQFVETLMGFPIGWTDFEPLETLSCLSKPSTPSSSSLPDSLCLRVMELIRDLPV